MPSFSYSSQPKTPFVEIENISVYFLNTCKNIRIKDDKKIISKINC